MNSSPDFCLCSHAHSEHTRRLGTSRTACRQCDCQEFDLDPFLEAGPDGRPVVTFLQSIDDLLKEDE